MLSSLTIDSGGPPVWVTNTIKEDKNRNRHRISIFTFLHVSHIHMIEMRQGRNKKCCKQQPENFAFYENPVWHNF